MGKKADAHVSSNTWTWLGERIAKEKQKVVDVCLITDE